MVGVALTYRLRVCLNLRDLIMHRLHIVTYSSALRHIARRTKAQVHRSRSQQKQGPSCPNRSQVPIHVCQSVICREAPFLQLTLYMAGANKGNPNPARERKVVIAATALAAYLVYESII